MRLSLTIGVFAEDELRQEAQALEEAGEELEDELTMAREEVAMLSNGMRKVNGLNEDKAELLARQESLEQELMEAREEIIMLESGMAALRAQVQPSEKTQRMIEPPVCMEE